MTESIIEMLKSKNNYRQVPQPLSIADVDFQFDFDAVLEGPDDHCGLVLILNSEKAPLYSVQRKIKAFSIVLARTNSMRPITLVLITEKINDPAIESLEKLCRVITISPNNNDLRTCLRTILPLRLPELVKTRGSTDVTLREELGYDIEDVLISALLKAAQKNSSEVEHTIIEAIDQAANFETKHLKMP